MVSGAAVSAHADFLLQLCVVLAVARALGEVAERAGLTPVVGELLTGVVLGPSLLAWAAPGAFAVVFPAGVEGATALDAVGQLGLVFLLVLAGLETDLDLIRRRAGATAWIAAGSLLVPFASGAALGWAIPAAFLARPDGRVAFVLFLATALSISAVPVIARTLLDLGVVDREPAQVLVAAALVNDVVGWLLLSVITGVVRAGRVVLRDAAVEVGTLAGFLAVALTAGRRAVDAVYARTRPGPPIGHLSTLVVLALGAAVIAEAVGVEAFLGAFLAGLLVGRTDRLDPDAARSFETLTLGVAAPVFFATAGLRADLTALADPSVAALAAVVLGVAIGGKLLGATAGATLAGYGRRDALGMGAGLNARGALELVVASVGLSLGVLTEATYAVIVAVAVVTTVVAVPLLRWAFVGAD